MISHRGDVCPTVASMPESGGWVWVLALAQNALVTTHQTSRPRLLGRRILIPPKSNPA